MVRTGYVDGGFHPPHDGRERNYLKGDSWYFVVGEDANDVFPPEGMVSEKFEVPFNYVGFLNLLSSTGMSDEHTLQLQYILTAQQVHAGAAACYAVDYPVDMSVGTQDWVLSTAQPQLFIIWPGTYRLKFSSTVDWTDVLAQVAFEIKNIPGHPLPSAYLRSAGQ